MSEQQQIQNPKPVNPAIVSLVFMISFGIILSIIVTNQQRTTPPLTTEVPVEVALIIPTATSQPSSTPLPPTSTQPPPTPTALPSSTPTMTTVPSTAVPTAIVTPEAAVDVVVESESNASHDPALVAQGQQSYLVCSACHGPDARGLPNLGKDLVASEFVAGLTDAELLEFIKTGRPLWDPLNTTGIDMPPKGGNPALKDEDILAIIAYLRSLSADGGQ